MHTRKWFQYKGIRAFLNEEDLEVELVSKKYGKKVYYKKYVILN